MQLIFFQRMRTRGGGSGGQTPPRDFGEVKIKKKHVEKRPKTAKMANKWLPPTKMYSYPTSQALSNDKICRQDNYISFLDRNVSSFFELLEVRGFITWPAFIFSKLYSAS